MEQKIKGNIYENETGTLLKMKENKMLFYIQQNTMKNETDSTKNLLFFLFKTNVKHNGI